MPKRKRAKTAYDTALETKEARFVDQINSIGFRLVKGKETRFGKELDGLDKGAGLAVEFNGLRWHCAAFLKDAKTYHHDKWLSCREEGLSLLTVFEDVWATHEFQVLNHVRAVCAYGNDKPFTVKLGNKALLDTLGDWVMPDQYPDMSRLWVQVDAKDKPLVVVACRGAQVSAILLNPNGAPSGALKACLQQAYKVFGELKLFSDNCFLMAPILESEGCRVVKELLPKRYFVNIKTPRVRLTTIPDGVNVEDYSEIHDCGHTVWTFDTA